MPTSRFQWRALAELGALLLVMLLCSTTLSFAKPISRENFSNFNINQQIRDANNFSNYNNNNNNNFSVLINNNNNNNEDDLSKINNNSNNLTRSTKAIDYISLLTKNSRTSSSVPPPRRRKKKMQSETRTTNGSAPISRRPRLHRRRRKKVTFLQNPLLNNASIDQLFTLTSASMTRAKFRRQKNLLMNGRTKMEQQTPTTTTTELIESIESENNTALTNLNLETPTTTNTNPIDNDDDDKDQQQKAMLNDAAIDCTQPADTFKQLISNVTTVSQKNISKPVDNCTMNEFIAPPITLGADNDKRITINATKIMLSKYLDDLNEVNDTAIFAVSEPTEPSQFSTTTVTPKAAATQLAEPTVESSRFLLSRTDRSLHSTALANVTRRAGPGRKGKNSNLERNERSANLSHITGTARKIQLYIKNRFLQLLPDGTVNGTQEELSDYTILQRTTVDIGQIKIQGVATCLFLCMDSCGAVYGSKDFTEDCIFNESMEQHHYNTYASSHHSNARHILYLGFNRHGQPRKIQIPATRSLGKLATYTKALTQTVPVERVDQVVGRLFGQNHVRHGLKQLCESGRSLQDLTAKVMKPKPKCNSNSNSNNTNNSNNSNSNLGKFKKKKKKRRKCRDDEPESELCFKGVGPGGGGGRKKPLGLAQKNQNKCTDEECGANKNKDNNNNSNKRGNKKPNNNNNNNKGQNGGGAGGPGGKKNKKPPGPLHKKNRMTSTTTPKPEEEDDELEDDALGPSSIENHEADEDWEDGGLPGLTSNFAADYDDPFSFRDN